MIGSRHFLAIAFFISALTLSNSGFAQDPGDAPPAGEAPPEEEAPPAEEEEPTQGEPAPTEPAKKADKDDLSPEQRAEYEEHLRAGKQAYAQQDFDKAYSELEAAHAIHPKASILFNLALIAEKAGALNEAVENYQQFLQAPGVTLSNRKRASERLKAVQEILASSESVDEARQKQQVTDLLPALEAMGIESMEATDTAGGVTTETGDGDATTTQTTPTVADGDTEEPDATAGTSTTPEVDYKWPVYASFGTATAALVGGVVMVAMTNKRIDEGKAAGQAGDDAGLAAAEEDASTYATASAGLFIGGAVLAVVGSYFVVRNSMDAEPETNPQPTPEPSASVSLSLHKNFLGPVFSLKF